MADFKLGVAGSELDLPLCVAEELPVDAADSAQGARMQSGAKRYDFSEKTPRRWELPFEGLTAAECVTLDGLDALKQILNYINGYQGLAAGVNVVILHWGHGTLKADTSGLTTPKYRGTMVLEEVL